MCAPTTQERVLQVQEVLSEDRTHPRCLVKDVRGHLTGLTDFSNLTTRDFAHANAILTSKPGAPLLCSCRSE